MTAQIFKTGVSEGTEQARVMRWAMIARWHGFPAARHWIETGIEPAMPQIGAGSGLERRSGKSALPPIPPEAVAALRWLHHIPNGGSRGGTAKERMKHGARLKAEGVRSGVADLFLPHRSINLAGLYVELKKTGGGTRSDKQKQFGRDMRAAGYGFAFCDGWIAAIDCIEMYILGQRWNMYYGDD